MIAVKMIGGVARLVEEKSGRIARSKFGKPIDGGRANAKDRGVVISRRQARHINLAVEK